MKDEPITVEDYKLVSDEFFQKYNYVADRLGPTKKAEDILKSNGIAEWCSYERTSERKGRTFWIQ